MKKGKLKMMLVLSGLIGVAMMSDLNAQDLQTAIQYTKSEQYDLAETAFQQLLQKEPSNSNAYFFYGENVLLNFFSDTISNSLKVSTDQARDLYNKGIQAEPNNPLNYVGLAKVAFYLGDDQKAQEYRMKAKSLLPAYKKVKKIANPKNYAYTLAKIAESYIRFERVDTSLAMPFLREALKIDKRNPDVYIIAGDIYILVNDGSQAIRNYNLAQDNDPTSPTANMKIASIYVKGRNLMAAIPFYEKAISLNANYAPAYRELGQLYASAARFDESKEYFRKYLELSKGNIPAQIRYVTSLFYAKEYDEVVRNVEEIFKIDQSRAYLNRIAAYSCFEKENPDLDAALRYMETFFSSSPERIIKKDYLYLSKILLRRNLDYSRMLQDTIRYNRELVTAMKNYSAASSGSAAKARYKANIDTLNQRLSRLSTRINQADAEIDRAFQEYEKALEFDPNDKTLLAEISQNAYAYRRYELAATTGEKLLDLGRNSANDYMQIGRAYYQAKNYKKAEEIFTTVTQKFPDNLQAYVMIARTYSQRDPDTKTGIARPKFELLLNKAAADSVKNAEEMMEAFGYLAYYYLSKENYTKAGAYYDRMINLTPDNNEYQARGYLGKANVSLRMIELVKEADEKLPYLERSLSYYDKVLELDPTNQSAKSSIQYVSGLEKRIRGMIVPNEIRGVIKNRAGEPLSGASVRVKDTAAETLTNAAGAFKFQIPKSSEILIFSARGYQAKEIPVSKKTKVYNVVLDQ